MTGRTRDGGGVSQSSANRQNEYFVPRDGIDREVITADICRYLGNDALVRPGTYQVRLSSLRPVVARLSPLPPPNRAAR